MNGKKVAEGKFARTQPMIFSADETADVGIDIRTPVVVAIGARAQIQIHRPHQQDHP